jgi:hypothetical protein
MESYGFESGQHKQTIKANRKLVEDLKEGYKFVYQVFTYLCSGSVLTGHVLQTIGSSEAECKGLYHNKNIQKIVNAMWFAKKHDEGVIYHEYFKPLHVVTVALVLTAV